MSKMGNEQVRQRETGEGCPGCGKPTIPVGMPCEECVDDDNKSLHYAVLGYKLFRYGFSIAEETIWGLTLSHRGVQVAKFGPRADRASIHRAAWDYLHTARTSIGGCPLLAIPGDSCTATTRLCLLTNSSTCPIWEDIVSEWGEAQ